MTRTFRLKSPMSPTWRKKYAGVTLTLVKEINLFADPNLPAYVLEFKNKRGKPMHVNFLVKDLVEVKS